MHVFIDYCTVLLHILFKYVYSFIIVNPNFCLVYLLIFFSAFRHFHGPQNENLFTALAQYRKRVHVNITTFPQVHKQGRIV